MPPKLFVTSELLPKIERECVKKRPLWSKICRITDKVMKESLSVVGRQLALSYVPICQEIKIVTFSTVKSARGLTIFYRQQYLKT